MVALWLTPGRVRRGEGEDSMFDAMRRNMKTIMWITAGAFVLLIFLAWGEMGY